MDKAKELLKNKYVQLVLALLAGITIGVLFYPTKTIEERTRSEIKTEYSKEIERMQQEFSSKEASLSEKLSQQEGEFKEYKEEVSQRYEMLMSENRELRQSMKKQKFKLVKPDGTIIEKEYEESQSEEVTSVVREVRQEFDRKVSSIEDKWKKIHTERLEEVKKKYEAKIAEVQKEKKTETIFVEKEKIVKVNEKSLRVEIGGTSSKDIYSHVSYPLWGPVFIGGGASGNTDGNFGEARIGLGIEF